MRDEVLEKALSTDASVTPRYDIVKPDGTKVAENVQVVLKNKVLVQGTPLNAQSLLKDTTATSFDLNPVTATPDDALAAIRNSVGYCPKLKVTINPGATLYVKNSLTSVQKAYNVPVTGIITVDIWEYGTYIVWGVINEVTTAETSVTIDTTKEYAIEITADFFVAHWHFRLLDVAGAIITATHTDGTVVSAVAQPKSGLAECVLALTKEGTWTAVGEYDGCMSNTQTLNVTAVMENTTTTNSNLGWAEARVYVDTGAVVTMVSGSTTRSGISNNGVAHIILPFLGTWAITATLGDKVVTGSVNVTTYQNHNVTLSFYDTYGVRIPLNNSSPVAAEYTDNAIGMSTGYTAWSTKKIFNGIRPCVVLNGVVQYYLNKENLAQKEDGTPATINSFTAGDVMVEVPKIGYRIYTDNNYLYVKITEKPNDPNFCYYAHSLDSEGDCSKIYYGAYLMYHTTTGAYSVSGVAPTANNSIDTIRQIVSAKGAGYQMMSFYPWILLQCLYIIMYKDLNGQAALGTGYTGRASTESPKTTGSTNARGACYGESTGALQMCFLNIEDLWGNLWQWIDGVFINSSNKLLAAYKSFNNNGASYPYSATLGTLPITGYIASVVGTNTAGFLSKSTGASATTYFCDTGTLAASSVLIAGTSFFNNLNSGGPFCYNTVSPTSPGTDIGARLMYKKKG